jgi:hypothetical protein
MKKLIIKLESYEGRDTSLQVDTTGHPETDEMFCIVSIEDGQAVDVDCGYRTFEEAAEILKPLPRK